MTEHAGCILAIVGSRDVNKISARALIKAVIDEHKPLVVVSGGAKVNWTDKRAGKCSIDQEAAEIGREQQLQVLEFLPTKFTFHGPGGFAERNMKIVDICMCLVRIASDTSTTYGSGWTADRAETAGKEVTRYVIKADGTVLLGQMVEGVFVPA